ncbi:hypothetical protein [Edaphocola aurantiacus]|uniref:hypothetical protein n=1 Tax=Edaphocola aurantiacus TaxID=2601682 RepID=UPI001C9378AC|nr:hypothetical protein [Edaphocola aurantiacus]
MSTQLYIAEPCHEDWSAMIPNDRGRHCDHCCKTVIDFTSWEAEDILHYLRQHTNACGRLRKEQLLTPVQQPGLELVPLISASPLSYIKKMAAVIALLFVFASCNNPAAEPVHTAAVQTDTAVVPIVGELMAIPPPAVPEGPSIQALPRPVTPPKPAEVVYPNESYVQGGISIPDPPEVVAAPPPPSTDTSKMGPFPE